MRGFFSAFGPVVDCTVMVDRDSGRSKGFGFVTFEDSSPTNQLVGKSLILDEKQVSFDHLKRLRGFSTSFVFVFRLKSSSRSLEASVISTEIILVEMTSP